MICVPLMLFAQKIKQNNLYQLAMEKPKEYIKRRVEMMQNLKTDIDKEYKDTFKQYTSGSNALPISQAKELAMKSADLKYRIGMEHIESVLPSQFANLAYNAEIQKQTAQNITGK